LKEKEKKKRKERGKKRQTPEYAPIKISFQSATASFRRGEKRKKKHAYN